MSHFTQSLEKFQEANTRLSASVEDPEQCNQAAEDIGRVLQDMKAELAALQSAVNSSAHRAAQMARTFDRAAGVIDRACKKVRAAGAAKGE